MLIAKYTNDILLQTSSSSSSQMVSPTYPPQIVASRSSAVSSTTTAREYSIRSDAFLEPYVGEAACVIQDLLNGRKGSSADIFYSADRDVEKTQRTTRGTFSSTNRRDEKITTFDFEHFNGGGANLNQMEASMTDSEEGNGSGGTLGDEDEEEVIVGGEDVEEAPCDITLLERLIRTHPIWFLPGIQRAGAFHLLQGKQDGNFVVRQSSQSSTMAISVRLPSGKGPYIEHYLIQASEDDQIGLESSENKFPSIPTLVAHYCQCCDELPVQLCLPRAIMESKTRQQLTSLALLGQEFWRYPMANSDSLKRYSPKEKKVEQKRDSLDSGSSNSPPSSLSSFDSGHNVASVESFSAPLSPIADVESTNCNNVMSTFKGSAPSSLPPHNQIGIPIGDCAPSSLPVDTSHNTFSVRKHRPTPPNTLNLVPIFLPSSATSKTSIVSSSGSANQLVANTPSSTKTPPPPPPPRWTKPSQSQQNSFVITTTLTIGVDASNANSPVQVTCVQIPTPEERVTTEQDPTSPTGPKLTLCPVAKSFTRSLTPQTSSPSPISSQIMSPISEGCSRSSHKRSRRYKESRHYRESDIIECNFSRVADKASDYEDIWNTMDSGISSFKHQRPSLPEITNSKTVDVKPRLSLPKLMISERPENRLSPETNSNEHAQTPPVAEEGKCGPPPDLLGVAGDNSVAIATGRNRLGLVLNDDFDDKLLFNEKEDVKTPTAINQEFDSLISLSDSKTSSPFYAEPADAIKRAAQFRRRIKSPTIAAQRNRHSEPPTASQWPPQISANYNPELSKIESSDDLPNNGFSSSMDNLYGLRNSIRGGLSPISCKNIGKPVEPPKIGFFKKLSGNTPWAVDSSWEFLGNGLASTPEKEEPPNNAENETDRECKAELKFPSLEQQAESDTSLNKSRTLTVQDLINKRLPIARLSPVTVRKDDLDQSRGSECGSSYDNVLGGQNGETAQTISSHHHLVTTTERVAYQSYSIFSQVSDTSDDNQTEFSEPWDISNWEHLLPQTIQENIEPDRAPATAKSFKERLDPFLCAPRLKALATSKGVFGAGGSPGGPIRNYAMQLAADKSTVFAQSIDNFIACTVESRESNPQVVMRNMRQFMSGMKNYLVKHGERDFLKLCEKERNKLKGTEFLNLDAILEGVMMQLIVSPLKEHVYQLCVDQYVDSGDVELLAENMRYARTRPPTELGIRTDKIILPSESELEPVYEEFKLLQMADSPLDKVEHLLCSIAAIYHSIKVASRGQGPALLGADDFLPLFIWMLAQTGMVAAEIEAEFMWGLLHSSLLSGEGGYYLTTLSSAVSVLKTLRECSSREGTTSTMCSWYTDPMSEFRSVLRVVVPDELNGSLLTKTLPVRPNMTVRDICKIIALKLRITNPQDYALFKLVEGEETLLNDNDLPQDVKAAVTKMGKHCIFAYKRIDAKIGWPRTSQMTSSTVE